jgi:hypothetical protein
MKLILQQREKFPPASLEKTGRAEKSMGHSSSHNTNKILKA